MDFSSNQSLVSNAIGQKIEIFLSGRSLCDMDVFSKSDPYVKILFKRNFNVKSFEFIGRT